MIELIPNFPFTEKMQKELKEKLDKEIQEMIQETCKEKNK